MNPERLTIFRGADAPPITSDTMSAPALDPKILEELDFTPIVTGAAVDVLFRAADDDGFSLVRARLKPGYRLPRHSHSSDCLYYVVSGSAVMGRRVLEAGDGFFVPRDAPYAYEAGPDGVEVLEFRGTTTFNMVMFDQTVAKWRPIVAAAIASNERAAEASAAS